MHRIHTVPWANKKRGTLLLYISLTIIDRFSNFFHWHTLQTSCINVITTTLQTRLYTTLWNTNVKKLTIITNIYVNEKNTSDQHCGEWSVWHWTVLDAHSQLPYGSFATMLVWNVFLSILPKILFVIIVIYAYFIYISQDRVETHLQCSGMYNNHIIANCQQSVPVK